jgi:nucleoid-associated protein YgaU
VAGKQADSAAVVMGPKSPDNLTGELSRPKDPLIEPPAPKPAPLPAAPLGAPPGASSAPIPVPLPPPSSNPAATVRSWDTVSAAVKPGESTFADLSKRLYNSEKYAQPLLLYNREYNPAAEDLRADPPRLKSGLPILVPPTYILELPRYAEAPAAPKPAAAPNTHPPEPAVVLAPRPAAAATPTPPAPPSSISAVTLTPPIQAGSRRYLVRGNGEMLFEIARQTLGDGRRWSEIYRLNPDIRPELAIPGGTQLRLPADARVGS